MVQGESGAHMRPARLLVFCLVAQALLRSAFMKREDRRRPSEQF